jgi:cytochrome c-type biogenesis protein CcmH
MIVLLLLLLLAVPAHAVEPQEMLASPELEARARTIGAELRCVVCQNESVDTSQASLAHDMRLLIRQKLEEGESDRQIIDYLRGRYGDFVLMQPPFTSHTAALWLAPGLALLAGTGIVAASWHNTRRRRRRA